jgi:hypothetical protein
MNGSSLLSKQKTKRKGGFTKAIAKRRKTEPVSCEKAMVALLSKQVSNDIVTVNLFAN